MKMVIQGFLVGLVPMDLTVIEVTVVLLDQLDHKDGQVLLVELGLQDLVDNQVATNHYFIIATLKMIKIDLESVVCVLITLLLCVIGADGLPGQVGFTGDSGRNGLVGATGSPGIPGSRGDVGVLGVDGPKGVVGPAGVPGASGGTGDQGGAGYGRAGTYILPSNGCGAMNTIYLLDYLK